jgi:hypothetical protein
VPRDLTAYLWLLKLGALLNLYFLVDLDALPAESDIHLVLPAGILLAVSGYRCLFPNRYKDNVVLHDTALSSTFVTRSLATFSEIAFIYLLSYVIRMLNLGGAVWVDAASWLMVAQVVVSQCFVWGAILSGRLTLYYYEELGWAVIFVANTVASGWLYTTVELSGGGAWLVELNLIFGLVYLPWQIIHLRSLRLDARENGEGLDGSPPVTTVLLRDGLRRSVFERSPRTDSEAWGGLVGLTWMMAYWATLIPLWVHQIVVVSVGS